MPQIIEHLESIVGALDSPPILIGHSAGGVFTQILLDHGFGAAGVAINSAPTEGVKRVPLSQIRATFPVLKNPANRHKAVGFTFEQWHYAFTNSFTEDESRRLYERYHIPASGEIFWGSALANIHPGKDDTWVDYHNDDRAPLLFISGSDDHLMPPSIQQSNAKHYKSDTITEVKEFEGPHLLPAAPGWEEVADYALDWAVEPRRPAQRRVTDVRLTHIGGPTVADRGRRLAAPDRPDVRPARPAGTPSAGGATSRKIAGPAIAAAERRPDRRGAAQPRPPRRQPRRRRTGAAAVGRRGDHHRVGRADARRRQPAGCDRGQTTRLEAPDRPTIDITATPCRHGPPQLAPIVGDVIGFALRWDGQEHGVALDLRRHRALRRRARGGRPARRSTPPCCISAACSSPSPGPVRYTMTARDAVELCGLVKPRTTIPIHYEGWKHLRQKAAAVEQEFARAPEEIRSRVRWLPIGVPVEI